ncbi:protein kinase [Triangularia setosa]|uniref:Protein kinase n=1 Tax=Triangularia setosa TaxID=2587417 RepID=A0AAN6WBA6_9PEZI|nr:protein kinase [Podospora setosa]
MAKEMLGEVVVPKIYFSGKVSFPWSRIVVPIPTLRRLRATSANSRETSWYSVTLFLAISRTEPADNIIIRYNRIGGIVDWKMAGRFGWKPATRVYCNLRLAQRGGFWHIRIREGGIDNIVAWWDLYDEGPGVQVSLTLSRRARPWRYQ